jgi:hypothetical protein
MDLGGEMSKKRPPVEDGEWIQPVVEGYKLECCDCGVVHTLNFRIKDGEIQFQAVRDNRATGQTRRFRTTPKSPLRITPESRRMDKLIDAVITKRGWKKQ